ncbi:MAG: hypothetical protein LC723_06360 [Actinobacteria bacterium]|nr:hypothetical protein [Actinomycetota bacterium]
MTIDTLTVTGDATVDGTMAANAVNAGTVDTSGNAVIGGTLNVTGNATVAGLTATGSASMADVFAADVDANTLALTPPTTGIGVITVQPTGDAQSRFQVLGTGDHSWGNGANPADATLVRTGVNALQADVFFRIKSGQSDGDYTVFGTSLSLGTAGGGIKIKEGANACMGVATLALGSATINTTKVTANSRIFLTVQSLGTVSSPKAVCVFARTAGTSFQIASSDATDTSVIAWEIKEPA